MSRLKVKILLCFSTVTIASPVCAQTVSTLDFSYMLNTLSLLVSAVLVMMMAAGFTMIQAGSVRNRSVSTVLTENITLYSIASIVFFVVGYEFMYGESVAGIFGQFKPWTAAEVTDRRVNVLTEQPSSASWFFEMVFAAITAAIVSGALAERIKFWPFAVIVAFLAGVLYPMTGHWTWGGGWLADRGFVDFAGATIVHAVGGWAALAGLFLLGARRGRFDIDGNAHTLPQASLPLAALGTFTLWIGWFGLNGGSQMGFSTPQDALAVATIFTNTNVAAAAGVITVTLTSQLVYRRLDLALILNGALAGLVSISADPLSPSLATSAGIGSFGGLLMIAATKLLEQLQLDDVVGAIPVHLVAGTWGTLAVCLSVPSATLETQLLGIVSIGAFVFSTSFALWALLRRLVGIRNPRITDAHSDEEAACNAD